MKKLKQAQNTTAGSDKRAAKPVTAEKGFSFKSRNLPVAEVQNDAFYRLDAALKIWRWILFSFPLDYILFLALSVLPLGALQWDNSVDFYLVCVVFVGVIFCSPEFAKRMYLKLSKAKSGETTSKLLKHSSYIKFAADIAPFLVVAGGAFFFGEFLISALFGVFVIINFLRFRSEEKRASVLQKTLAEDRELWLLSENNQILIFVLIPPILTRSISFLGLIKIFLNGEPIWVYFLYLVTSLVLTAALAPKRELFVANCKTCAQWTSLALNAGGFCPNCKRALFRHNPHPNIPEATGKEKSAPQIKRISKPPFKLNITGIKKIFKFNFRKFAASK